MENITMTMTTQIARPRCACPQIVGNLLAGTFDGRRGTTVSSLGRPAGFGTALSAVIAVPAPAFHLPIHKSVTDVAHLSSGRPPV